MRKNLFLFFLRNRCTYGCGWNNSPAEKRKYNFAGGFRLSSYGNGNGQKRKAVRNIDFSERICYYI